MPDISGSDGDEDAAIVIVHGDLRRHTLPSFKKSSSALPCPNMSEGLLVRFSAPGQIPSARQIQCRALGIQICEDGSSDIFRRYVCWAGP